MANPPAPLRARRTRPLVAVVPERRGLSAEGGQATPLVGVAVALAATVVLALATYGGLVVDAARARTAADAAALAAAADGREAAVRLAVANGGHLESFALEGLDVVVTVRVGRASESARARREGTWCDPEGREGAPTSYTSPPCPSSPG
ncbi:pilus assembly protein TadG-related protein [Iamia sp.]|uniref:pilus assembly protein TadG-related protein n=1 Tax=Iamia sp. TaxID=2722710 RepID=UPI002CAE3E91|nr:pilus assembly protein TadG-related protein [Iamia sp.]HXH57805.1 pilus assembly protein TadG-related protein [Iamia sp.]